MRFNLIAAACLGVFSAKAETVWLSSLNFSDAKGTDNIKPARNQTIGGRPLTINSNKYERGVSVYGYTVIYLRLAGGSDKFSAIVGVDDEAPPPPVSYGANGPTRGGGGGAATTRRASIRILADQGRVLYENASIPGAGTTEEHLAPGT